MIIIPKAFMSQRQTSSTSQHRDIAAAKQVFIQGITSEAHRKKLLSPVALPSILLWMN
jgi:hypothetical protein